jgi:YbgC/YbaW family acyl-CoA thioester hydrolase
MPDSSKLSEFTVTRRVQFYETDAAGIVHFSWYLRYLEEAEHAMWRAAGLSIAPAGSEFGFPRVSVSSDYRAPLRFEDEFETTIRIIGMTDKSIRYAGVMKRGDTLVANLAMTIVCVTKAADDTLRAAPLPTAVRTRFEVAADAIAGHR